jgi:hypothetical protein
MEFANGYDTLENFLWYSTNPDEEETKKAEQRLQFNARSLDVIVMKAMAMYLLLELASKTCYSHGDFHYGNIMFNPSATGYFADLAGKPLLIDFGYTASMATLPSYTNAKAPLCTDVALEVHNKNYLKALQIMCRQSRSDELDINLYQDFYGWACGNYSWLNNDELQGLFDSEVQRLTEQKQMQRQKVNKAEIENQAAHNLSVQEIDYEDPAVKRINDLIDKLFASRETAKQLATQSMATIGVSLPLPVAPFCEPLRPWYGQDAAFKQAFLEYLAQQEKLV